MGRSRSRDRDRKKDKKEKGEKDKDRDRDRDRKKDKKEPEPPPPEPEPPRPQRQRSPSFQYRRWRFDSPPKEEEYQRDAMLTGNPLGLGGVAAALQGGLGGAGISPLQLAADTKASRELYVGNLPAGITTQQLVQFLNQVAMAVKVNSLPGEPILGATMGGGGLFAFVEFRTAEEAANGLRLNGVELLGSQLKVGRPKGYTGAEGGAQSLLSLPAPTQTGGDAPSLAAMMAQAGALKPGVPGGPAGGGSNVVSAIDHRLCLINIPTFVGEDRIKELLVTFGQLKFFAMQKDSDGKSVGVAFFEYNDMMTQQQARAALEGLELGAKKLSVKRPEEVIELGLVSRVQKLGNRVVPSKVLYLKNLVTPDELRDDATFLEICADVRLESEKFGPVVGMEIPRPKGCTVTNHHTTSGLAAITSGMLALEYTGAIPSTDRNAQKENAGDAAADNSAAIMLHDSEKKKKPIQFEGILAVPGTLPKMSTGDDTDVPGLGFAFVEFATIEGASRAKKGLNGRQFGENEVVAEFYSENLYARRHYADPKPNTEEPSLDPEAQLARMQAAEATKSSTLLEEAPVMVE